MSNHFQESSSFFLITYRNFWVILLVKYLYIAIAESYIINNYGYFFTVFFSFCVKHLQKQPPEVFNRKISQNSQENTCARVFFLIKLQASACKLWDRNFPVNFAKFLRTHFLQNTSGRLLFFVNSSVYKAHSLLSKWFKFLFFSWFLHHLKYSKFFCLTFANIILASKYRVKVVNENTIWSCSQVFILDLKHFHLLRFYFI